MKKLLTLAFLAATAWSQTAPPFASSAGFSKLVFDEEFQTFDLAPSIATPSAHQWYPGLWWEWTNPSTSQVAWVPGQLTLTWNQAWYSATGKCGVNVSTMGRAGRSGTAFRYGYIEVKASWDNVAGAFPALWMIPAEAIQGALPNGELDIFEGQAGKANYFGTLHVWNNSANLWTSSPNRFPVPAGTDFTQPHVYGALWTAGASGLPGKVTWYFDSLPVGSASTTAFPSSVFDTERYLIVLTMQKSSCATGPALPMSLRVNYVRVWGS